MGKKKGGARPGPGKADPGPQPATGPVPLPPPLPPPDIPPKMLKDVQRLARQRAERRAKECAPAGRKVGEPLQPPCDAIETSHSAPRGEAMLRTRFAGALLFVVMILGIVNAVAVVNEGLRVNVPSEILHESSGLVYGRVTDVNGLGIEGAEVVLVGTSHRATTDTDGWYFIGSVPVRTYSVQANKANFTSVIKKVRVEEQMTRPVNFQLSPGTGVKKVDTRVPQELGDLQPFYGYSATANIIAAVLAAIGGYLCFLRTRFRTVLVFAAIGTLSYGFLIGAVLSVIAFILIAISRSGFVPSKAPYKRKAGRAPVETEWMDLAEAVEGDEVTLERPGEGPERPKDVTDAEARGLKTKGAEQEIGVAEGGRPPEKEPEEPIQDAEVKESLASKGLEAEGSVSDTEGEIRMQRRKREIKAAGPEVVGDMEKALKETMSAQEETETDIVASVLKKLDLDKPVAPVAPPKKSSKKKKGIKEHQERLLCRECVKPIILETEAIRCRCGRTFHIHCAQNIKVCKNCGRALKLD